MEPDMDSITAGCGAALIAALVIFALLVILVVIGLLT